MVFKDKQEFDKVAKRAVQILLFIAETKSKIFRGAKASNFITYLDNNPKSSINQQTGSVYFEITVYFMNDDPDHGPFCKKLDDISTAILNTFGGYYLNSNLEFVDKKEEGDDMVGFFKSCSYNWSNHEDANNSQATYGFEYYWYSDED